MLFSYKKYRLLRRNISGSVALPGLAGKQGKQLITSAQGIDAAMLQLTQAMGSGVLRGEEYNSILEQAPNIIQAIAKYMDVPKGQLKEMAADGKITADIVKAAMFACADETNAKFESMPKTWSDIWTSMKNRAIKALDPVLAKINQLANSERVQQTVNGLTLPVTYGGTGQTSLAGLAAALAGADGGLGKIETGTYTGTGGYGTSNKKTLTFSAPPKLLVVMPETNTSNGQRGGFIALRGISSSRGGGIMDDVSGDWGQLYYTWSGNSVTWYGTGGEGPAQNLNGMTYHYFAIL